MAKIFWGGILALVALVVVAAIMSPPDHTHATSPPNATSIAAVAIPDVVPRDYTNDDCATASKKFSAGGMTELQQKEKWKEYDGKWVHWSGIVSEVGETFGRLHLQVKCHQSTITSDAVISFGDDWRATLLSLQAGDLVVFNGQLRNYNRILGLSIGKGEIVSCPPSFGDCENSAVVDDLCIFANNGQSQANGIIAMDATLAGVAAKIRSMRPALCKDKFSQECLDRFKAHPECFLSVRVALKNAIANIGSGNFTVK